MGKLSLFLLSLSLLLLWKGQGWWSMCHQFDHLARPSIPMWWSSRENEEGLLGKASPAPLSLRRRAAGGVFGEASWSIDWTFFWKGAFSRAGGRAGVVLGVVLRVEKSHSMAWVTMFPPSAALFAASRASALRSKSCWAMPFRSG